MSDYNDKIRDEDYKLISHWNNAMEKNDTEGLRVFGKELSNRGFTRTDLDFINKSLNLNEA